MLSRTNSRFFSTFAVNPETSAPPHGSPRGTINRFVKIGLPPWAAWCGRLNRYTMYRMSVAVPRYLRPKRPQEMDQVWMNEQVRERVRTSPQVQNVYRQLKYPWMRTGIWYSAALDHWVQVPHVMAAKFAIEREGGFDNFIMNRPGHELQSRYGERIRRHIIVRQDEIKKNFVLQQQAQHLADVIEAELAAATSREGVAAVMKKFGLPENLFARVAGFIAAEEQRQAAEAAEAAQAAWAASGAASDEYSTGAAAADSDGAEDDEDDDAPLDDEGEAALDDDDEGEEEEQEGGKNDAGKRR